MVTWCSVCSEPLVVQMITPAISINIETQEPRSYCGSHLRRPIGVFIPESTNLTPLSRKPIRSD